VRLPWPFGRSASDGAASGSGGDAGSGSPGSGSPAAGASSSPAEAPIRPTGAWRTLPPIQRSSGPPPVVAPAAPFLADVPGHAALSPIVTPLGHESSPSAPAGLVVAHPHAVPSLTSSAPLPTRPVRRQAGGESAASAAPAADAEESPVVSRRAEAGSAAAASPATASPASWSPAAAPELPPIRTVPAVAPSAVATPASRPLTRTAPVLAPLPAGRSGGIAASAESRRSRPADVAPPIQASGRVPGPVSTSPSAAPDAGRAPLAPVRRFAELPVEAPAPPVQRETTGHRRAGLGAPLRAAPDTAVAQQLPVRPGQALAKAVAPASPAASSDAVARLSDGAHDVHDPAPAVAAPSASPARPLPVLPVARRRQDAAPASPGVATPSSTARPASTGTSSSAASSVPTVSRSAATVRPTVGARPLRPAVTATPAGPGRSPRAAGRAPMTRAETEAPAPVAARWDAADTLPMTVTSLRASPRTEPDLPVQLSPVDAGAGPAPMPPAANGIREIVFPLRDDGGEAPAWSSGGFPPTPSAAQPASSAGPRTAPLPLARSVVAAPALADASAPAAASAPVVARIVADPASPGTPPVVRTQPAGGGIPVATFTATPIVQREEAPAPTAPQPSNGRSDRELDELAKALFGRFRTQLKSEVIHEREAKGLGFDAF
jgi:DNA polymerase-3 subunit gamma/tau